MSEELKKSFREVLEEVGLIRPKTPVPDDWDVTREDSEGEDLVPVYVAGSDPVAVELVTTKPVIVVERGSLAWNGSSTVVGATPAQIVGKEPRRRSVTIVNLSLNSIALGHNETVKFVTPPGFGSAILPANSSVTINTRSDIWAVAASSSTGEGISIYQVFDDGA